MTRCMLVGVTLSLVLSAVTAHGDVIPKRRKALFAWLKAGTYRSTYTCQPAVEPSNAAHGANVRTCYSPALVQALAAGTLPFPRGVGMVKELYFGDPSTISGYAVMSKVRRRSGPGGQGWFWFETFDGASTIAIGRGVGLCAGCHSQGTDFLRSPFRP